MNSKKAKQLRRDAKLISKDSEYELDKVEDIRDKKTEMVRKPDGTREVVILDEGFKVNRMTEHKYPPNSTRAIYQAIKKMGR